MPLRIVVAVLAGLLACGLPLWPIPYREVSMPGNPAASTWLMLGALAGLLAGYLVRERLRAPVAAVTGGFVLAVLVRVSVETARDPTSHNLWPFEVVIAAGVGVLAAMIGVGIARVLQWATGRASSRGGAVSSASRSHGQSAEISPFAAPDRGRR